MEQVEWGGEGGEGGGGGSGAREKEVHHTSPRAHRIVKLRMRATSDFHTLSISGSICQHVKAHTLLTR